MFVKCIDYKEKVIYIFKFPKEYIHEYNEFKESRYSTFLNDAKKQILQFWTILKGNKSTNFVLTVKQILYKEKILKTQLEKQLNTIIDDNAELGSFVDLNEETINLDKYKDD